MKSLLTLNRLAFELKLPREWLHDEAGAGRIPCLKVGRRYFFNPEAVERTLAKRAAIQRQVSADQAGEIAHAL